MIFGFDRNDIKVSFDETKFYVNEKKGTVVCVVKALVKLPYNSQSCLFMLNENIVERGVAKCSSGDTFDAERGKRIALARAENKVYYSALSYLDKYMKDISFMVNAYENFCIKAQHACSHNLDYIDSLSYEAHPKYKKNLTKLKKG